MKRYVNKYESYRTFRGYVFMNGNPVTITDKGTLLAIQKEPGFEEVQDEEKEAPPQVLNPHECPKCGRVFKQGIYLHTKYCKG
jgi:hypothetical protein